MTMSKIKIIKSLLTHVRCRMTIYILGMLFFASQDVCVSLFIAYAQKEVLDFGMRKNYGVFFHMVITVLGVYLFVLLVSNIGIGLFDYINIYISNSIQRTVYRKIACSCLDNESKDGEIATHIFNESSMAAQLITYQVGMLLIPVMSILGNFIAIVVISPSIGCFASVFVLVPLVYCLAQKSRIRKLAEEKLAINDQFMAETDETISCLDTISIYKLEKQRIDIINASLKKAREKNFFQIIYSTFQMSINNLAYAVYTLAVFLYGVNLYVIGGMELSNVLILPTLTGGILAGINGLCENALQNEQLFTAAERLIDFLNTDSDEPIKLNGIENTYDGNIALELRNVTFAYDNGKGPINVTANVLKNRITCIIGPVGIGKSTLIECILGIKKEQGGTIKAFGVEKGKVSSQRWNSFFAYVSQQTVLFDTTILENIVMGRDLNPERLEKSVQQSGLNLLLHNFPDGLNTKVGPGGQQLSGGERQIISLARALYSNAPIIVLDEFASALDEARDGYVASAIKQVLLGEREDKTFLIVSHKKTYIDLADFVITLG